MRASLSVLLFGLFILLAGCATAAPPEAAGVRPQNQPITILVAIDVFRADYLDRGITPNLSAVAARCCTVSMRPAFPTVTFPNLYTLLTGKWPDRHGVVGNTFQSADRTTLFGDDRADRAEAHWWSGALPLWASAEAQGIGTAHLFYLTPGMDAAGK